jgi:radical SAM superfamily enzyme YgiQ (UPF0313 family)
MIGFPTETYKEASDTVEFANRSNFHRASFLLVTPFAGTELADMGADILKNKNSTIDPRYMNYLNNSLNISAMSDTELHRVFRSAYRRFYMNPRKILRLTIHHPRFLSLPRYAFITLLKFLPRRYNPT